MMIDFHYSIAGAAIGLVVGMTGIGGGSLMTPLLILVFGVNPAIAVGTDLVMASITKFSGALVYQKRQMIRWDIALTLLAGSLPGAIFTLIWLRHNPSLLSAKAVITSALGVALIITSFALFFAGQLRRWRERHAHNDLSAQQKNVLTVLLGFALGLLVTLSSVGAGALGTTILWWLFPTLPLAAIIGTEIAHAVLLTAVAGIGHWQLGTVDVALLVSLLLGSLPGVWIGSHLGLKVPEVWLQRALASILIVVGFKVTF